MNKNKPKTLYSDVFCDEVSINPKHYDEFVEKFKESVHYQENREGDMLYFADEMFHGSSPGTTKQRLRLKLADIANVIEIDKIIELKYHELKPLLNASIENYLSIFHNVLLSNTEVIKTVDPE
ncbi:MAG: hypothetical protein PHD15_01360 [Clostridia bacterium]|nr:hypothetical protein [Clostridia bacterium]MDD4386397.1 hypothetical protein [Clostridia bacterium]